MMMDNSKESIFTDLKCSEVVVDSDKSALKEFLTISILYKVYP